MPYAVIDAMTSYLVHHNANTHWRFPSSVETDEALESARLALADFLGATPREIAFGNNMTTLTFHVARALGRRWTAGDEVIVTELDHHANVAPWHALAVERGVTVRIARMVRETGAIDWTHLEGLVSSRTKLLAIGAASNALGTINDVGRAARLVHAAGGLLFVDAVHYAAHLPVDVNAFDCDLLACSAYKFYGPHVGVLYGREPLLASLDVPKLAPAPDTTPERLETGTQNHEGIVGAAAAVDFLAGLAGDAANRRAAIETALGALFTHEHDLFLRLHAGLCGIPGVTVYGPPASARRTPTISFTVGGRTADEVARELASRALFLSHGNFYAATVHDRLAPGTDGFVRAGVACYTTQEEIDRLVEAVAESAG